MKVFSLLILLTTAPLFLVAQEGENWYYNIDKNNLALSGYDPVSYFGKDAPQKGEEKLSYEYDGVTYQFTTEQNLTTFKRSPEKYVPKYGGWCAYRMAQKPEEEGWGQSRIPVDPTNFKIIGNNLYVFSKFGEANMIQNWDAHEEKEMIQRANDFWDSRKKLAALANGKPDGLNVNARMENLLWDRLMGDWNGKLYQMVDTSKKEYALFSTATWTFFYGFDGFCIQDEWKPEFNMGGTWNGPAIRGYDPAKQEWHMTFIPVNAGRDATWLMTGKFNENNELEGYHEGTDAQGRAFSQKIFFYDISKDSFSWRTDRSYDEGKTWIKKFNYVESVRPN